LHIAVQHGHIDVVRRLLAESDIDVLTTNSKYVYINDVFYVHMNVFNFNSRGMNCLHVLATNSTENAQIIFSTIMEHNPTFPLDIQDEQGNTGIM
jgi:hypothetical protein